MLHLSLLTLPRSSPRWRFLQPYQVHQALWKGFGGKDGNAATERFLYRHNEGDKAHSVLVQSSMAPDWSYLNALDDGTTVQVRQFDPAGFTEGSHWRFLLRANPAVLRQGDPTSGRQGDGKPRLIPVGSDRRRMAERLGVELDQFPTREEQLIQWLRRKGGAGGFDLVDCIVGPNRDLVIRRNPRESPITLTTVEFDGILYISDTDRFATTLRGGIGRGKGFGLGLLSVMRA